MFTSVLIANRGEIACRIARTARALGMRVIAVHSEADRGAPFVRLAEASVEIGPAAAAESYLSIARVVEAVRRTAAAAVHPGYGFLAENAAFAEAVTASGAVFVGPPAAVIRAMGLKDEAKAAMARAGVPVLQGAAIDPDDPQAAAGAASRIGYPVMVKAVAGGGGKGMRRVDDPAALPDAVAACAREAQASFGDPRLILERCIDRPRHIEVQVFADRHGNVVHLHERDCSLQRRHQKVIEEAPAPNLPDGLRAAMLEAAVTAARTVGYEGAGTVEFICACDSEGVPTGFWFLEMNTRLQVEHPVTEAITGLDLVEWQFRVAAGEPLPLAQGDIRVHGHAVEARLYAENPATGFLPQTGRLCRVGWPAGARVDTGVEQGGVVSAHYDPLLAKLIVHGDTRAAALARMEQALAGTRLMGVTTNRAFLMRLAGDPCVRDGQVDTGLIDRRIGTLTQPEPALVAMAVRAFATPHGVQPLPFSALAGFALAGLDRRDRLECNINGRREQFEIEWKTGGSSDVESGAGRVTLAGWQEADGAAGCQANGQPLRADLVRDGARLWLAADPGDVDIAPAPLDARTGHGAKGEAIVRAPMPGRIGRLLVEPGRAVEAGAPLMTLEAMKMEHMVRASADGLAAVAVRPGDQVEEGQVLAEIVPVEEPAP